MGTARHGRLAGLLALAVAATVSPGADGADAADGISLPDRFADELVTPVAAPTALAFLPDGRLLVATQPGRLYVDPGGVPALALDLSGSTCSDLERGMLGVAVDPDFGSHPFVYVFYTSDDAGRCTHRVSRFTMAGDVADPASETVLIDGIPSANANHNAGDLQFGRDGHLYVSVGDGGCDYAGGGCAGGNDAARDEHILLGKILRLTRDGGIPEDNPFVGPDSDRCASTGGTTAGRRCRETFAWGLRNPFRLAFDPNAPDTRFFINDVGQHHWEEINEGRPGADYGWNEREGHCATGSFDDCGDAPEGMTEPIFDYPHRDGCGAITGGAFVPAGLWPGDVDGAYLFGDYNCGRIFRLVPRSEGGFEAETFATGFGPGSPVHLAFGPSGATSALYYTTYANGGEVRRISYAGTANRVPVAALAVDTASGPAPLRVRFDASGSTDPDGDDLSYEWDFGDGSEPEAGPDAATKHTYEQEAVYRASVVAVDEAGGRSAPAEVVVGVGRSAPTARIESPGPDHRFHVGEDLTFMATAEDAEDGRLPAERLTWTVLLHHDTHTHPFLGPVTGDSVRIRAPAPESISAAGNSYLEVHLSATDADGMTTATRLDLLPRKVDIAFVTDPPGFGLAVNAEPLIGPATITSWEGWRLEVEARDQTHEGDVYVFESWSDGGAARHTITTPGAPASYTARFVTTRERNP